MKIKECVLLCFSCLLCLSVFAQQKAADENIPVLKNFVQRLNNPDLATDVILSQDLITAKTIDNDLQEYLLASIDEVRINVQSKDIEKFEYLNFLQAGRKETNDIDLEGINPQQVYFVRYLKRFVFAAVVLDNKIASITLVSKGNNQAHFVFY